MTGSENLEAKRLLIVDDDQAMRALIRRMLIRMKIKDLAEAEGGEQALQQIETAGKPVDLVICDWNMPGMSGMDLFGRVHTLRPRLPFLMLTGRADANSVIAAKQAGISAYIVKPISPEELRNKVVYLLGKAA